MCTKVLFVFCKDIWGCALLKGSINVAIYVMSKGLQTLQKASLSNNMKSLVVMVCYVGLLFE